MEDLSGRTLSPPMLSKKKIVIIHNGHELTRDEAALVEQTAQNAVEDVIIIVLCINESAPCFETVRKAEERFKNAYAVKLEMPKKMSKDMVKKMSEEMGLNLPEKIYTSIFEKSGGEYGSVKNILQMGYIINDNEIFIRIFKGELSFENYAFVTFDFIKSFFEKDVQTTVALYEKITKWKLMNVDGITMMMLKQISKKIPGSVSSGRIGNWSTTELQLAYEEFYTLLKNLRKYRAEFAPVMMEEAIMKILMKGDKWT